MDKNESFSTLGHVVTISERKNIVISGVKKIESFDNEEFLMESNMGVILLKGESLELNKLDTSDGNVKIKGKINSLSYVDGKTKNKDEGLFTKLFK